MKLVTVILNWIFGSAKTQTQPPKTVSETPKTLAETRAESRERIYASWPRVYWEDGWKAAYNALDYLIEIAESIEDLKMVLKLSRDTKREHFDNLWAKWLDLATSTDELAIMSRKCQNSRYVLIARKWYALSATYAQIRATPYTADEVLRELIAEKRRTLADEALKAASNCEELILQCNRIDDDDQPTSSLQSYAGWSNDEGLKPCTIKKLFEASHSLGAPLKDLRAEMEEKWRKSSAQAIDHAKSSADLRVLAEQIHPELLAVLNSTWDSVSHKDVEKAESEEELLAVIDFTRVTSVPRELVRSKISRMYEERVERSSVVNELLRIGHRACVLELSSVLNTAIEKFIRLAMTEEELRRAWDLTERYPDLRRALTKKLSSLIT
jgi:hypothetical protein